MESQDQQTESPDGDQIQINNTPKDAAYRVVYCTDGVFLEITRETAGGSPLLPDFVLYDLERRKIDGLKAIDTVMRLRIGENRIKLAPEQKEKPFDMDLMVRFGKDELTASMMLFPPSPGGSEIDADKALILVKDKWMVKYGLNEQAVLRTVENRSFSKTIPIASGVAPQKGEDAELVFKFQTVYNYAPRILKDGSADFQNIKIYDTVNENDVLVYCKPAQQGREGITVKGKPLFAPKGREAVLPKGRNVRLSEDGLELLAAVSGHVVYRCGEVEVTPVYTVKGDLLPRMGNIDFDGDVVVQGGVLGGLTIQASGSIEVQDAVEDVKMIAGRDIILRNGMQGMDRGLLKAGGHIVAKFLDRCTVEALGSVYSDSIVNSTTLAGGNVWMSGKWARISGGAVRAGREISASTIGSAGGDATLIEMGVAPELRMQLSELEKKRVQIKTQMDKIDNIIRIMPALQEEPPERAAMRLKLKESRDKFAGEHTDLQQKIEKIKEKLLELQEGRVNVLSMIYPNVKISINSLSFPIRKPMEYATFKYKDGEIVFTSYELKNS